MKTHGQTVQPKVAAPGATQLRRPLQRVSASYVSDDLRDREGALVWRVRFQDRWLYLYLLVEFQSQVDRTMAVRMMGYVSLLYQDLVRQGLQAWQPQGAEEGEPPEGVARQTGATATAQRLRLPPVLPIVLDKSRTPDTMQAVVGSLMEWLTQPEQDSLRRAFAVYILRVLLPFRVPGVAVPQVANLLELRTMLAETALDWKKQWLEEGEAKGEARGEVKGKRDTLTRLLTRRFGPLPEWAAHRLSTGTVEQLDVWFDRGVDAANLAEVFGGH